MADLYGLEQSGIDPEIASQMLGLKRRRDIANLMAQQGMAGIDMPSTPSGGYTPKISPLVGVAKVLQAYMANKMAGDADSEQAKLMGESQRRSAETMQGYEQMRRGTPAQPIADAGPGDAVDTSTTMNAVPGNPREAIANLLAKAPHMANNPLVRQDLANMKPVNLGPGHVLTDPTSNKPIASNIPPPKPVTPKFDPNYPIGGNRTQPHFSLDGVTWNPAPNSVPSDKFNPRPATQVNVNNTAERAGAVELAKLEAKTVGGLRDSAIAANQTLNVLNRMDKAIDSDNTASGIGAEVISGLQNVAVTLGDADLAKKASANEQYIGDVAELVRGKIKALGSGTAISNVDLLFTQRSMPELVKTKEGKKAIINAMREDLQYINNASKGADEYFRKNGSLSGWEPPKPQAKVTGGYDDAEKERRYQEFKRSQGR